MAKGVSLNFITDFANLPSRTSLFMNYNFWALFIIVLKSFIGRQRILTGLTRFPDCQFHMPELGRKCFLRLVIGSRGHTYLTIFVVQASVCKITKAKASSHVAFPHRLFILFRNVIFTSFVMFSLHATFYSVSFHVCSASALNSECVWIRRGKFSFRKDLNSV